jgi:DNA-binding NtrC family response regulator
MTCPTPPLSPLPCETASPKGGRPYQPTAREFLAGDSDAIQSARELIERVAPSEATVLITGETGTGKELAALALHRQSRRARGPMISVNCSAIPDTLLESELFGSERGAYTGAVLRHEGRIRMADGGTLVLDEIGEMSLYAQAKILRVVETKEVPRLGGKCEPVDIRVIAATHRDLERMVKELQFRADLLYRLNVVCIEMPSLRERKQDIPILVDVFVRQFNVLYHREVEGVTCGGMRLLQEHHWPGNIRELRNVIERAFITTTGSWIDASDLSTLSKQSIPPAVGVRSVILPTLAAKSEPDHLLEALKATHWNKSEAAKLLRLSRMTIYRKIVKYRLSEETSSAAAQDLLKAPRKETRSARNGA